MLVKSIDWRDTLSSSNPSPTHTTYLTFGLLAAHLLYLSFPISEVGILTGLSSQSCAED